MPGVNQKVAPLLSDLSSALRSLYGPRLRGVYLYGSYARGEQDDESDVDILVVLDRIDSYGAEIDRTSHLGSELSLKYGVSISKVFVAESDWRSADTLFLGNVRQEALPV